MRVANMSERSHDRSMPPGELLWARARGSKRIRRRGRAMAISNVDAIVTKPAQRPERVPGSPIAHLREFRSNRTAMQVRVARTHPHIAAMRFGLFDSMMVNAPAIAHEMLQT